jgi:hypothetical protein
MATIKITYPQISAKSMLPQSTGEAPAKRKRLKSTPSRPEGDSVLIRFTTAPNASTGAAVLHRPNKAAKDLTLPRRPARVALTEPLPPGDDWCAHIVSTTNYYFRLVQAEKLPQRKRPKPLRLSACQSCQTESACGPVSVNLHHRLDPFHALAPVDESGMRFVTAAVPEEIVIMCDLCAMRFRRHRLMCDSCLYVPPEDEKHVAFCMRNCDGVINDH